MSSTPPASEPVTPLAQILARVEAARKGALAPAAKTTLIAVSKTHAAARILPLLEAGHRVFGENRVQEAKAKWPDLRARFSDIELHLIGPLQTNKVREAFTLFDAIHSLDRESLAEAIARESEKTGRCPVLFVQVNTGEEPQKAGVAPGELPALLESCRQFGLTLFGLMCIPPADQPPAPHFAFLAKLAREAGLSELSMGMSADFESAIRFGATHIRVGSALFGERLSAG